MPHTILKLESFVNFNLWQSVQNAIAEALGCSLEVVDYKGSALSQISGLCSFCKNIQASRKLHEYCQRCYSMGTLEAVRTNQPFCFRCSFGIAKVVIPVIIAERYVGAVLTGQVRLQSKEEREQIPQYNLNLEENLVERALATYSVSYAQIPEMALKTLLAGTGMIDQFVRYILAERQAKVQEDSPSAPNAATAYTVFDPKDVAATRVNPLILPALQYISHNVGAKITLEEMAALVHLSPSYFSRLFSKELGISFSDYVIAEKLEIAKNLLSTTDDTITLIGQKLGYHDVGYFIKAFKKVVGQTPLNYREENKTAP